MKRRQLVVLLGFFSFGGAAAVWRLLRPLRRPDRASISPARWRPLPRLMFPGDGLPGVTDLGLHHRVLAMPELEGLDCNGRDLAGQARGFAGRVRFSGARQGRGSRPSMRRLHRRTRAFSHSCSRSGITWARPIIRRPRSRRPLPLRVRRSRTASPISRNAPHERRARLGCGGGWSRSGRRRGGVRIVPARTGRCCCSMQGRASIPRPTIR